MRGLFGPDVKATTSEQSAHIRRIVNPRLFWSAIVFDAYEIGGASKRIAEPPANAPAASEIDDQSAITIKHPGEFGNRGGRITVRKNFADAHNRAERCSGER